MPATLVYDGDCGFCTTCVRFIERRISTSAEIVPWQFADLDELGVDQAAAQDAVQWVAPDGTVAGGHEAVASLLIDAGGVWRPLGRLMLLPVIRTVAAAAYRLVANNRHRLPGGTPACAISPESRR